MTLKTVEENREINFKFNLQLLICVYIFSNIIYYNICNST